MPAVLDASDILVTTDFETGNGKNIERLADDAFRMEVEGDDSGYNYYFGVRILDKTKNARPLSLEVVPDPDLADTLEGDFYGNLNTHVWYTKAGMADQWGQFYRLPEFNFSGEGELEVSRSRYLIRIATVPGNTVWVTDMYPLPYSMMTRSLHEEASRHPRLMRLCSVGKSAEGRDIHMVELTEAHGEKPRVFVLSGQHPMEFPGQWAVWGMIRWLLSRVGEAVALRKRYRFYIVPQINPDGNVAGHPQKNAEGLNLNGFLWKGVAEGGEPVGHENRTIWQFLKANPPAVHLNFHGYCGPRAWGDWPHEGCYVPPPESFTDDGTRRRQEALNDFLLWHTDSGSQHKRLLSVALERGPRLCDVLARLFGTVSATYEPLDGKGHWNNMRTGVHLLTTALRAYEQAVRERE